MSTPFNENEKPTLVTLPLDIIFLLLEHCCDLDSLLSLMASCRTFYFAFHNYPTSLTHTLISREIDIAVLPDAIQLLKAAEISRNGPSFSDLPIAVSKLFGEGREALVKDRWSLADGIAAIRLHSIIDGFASKFASYYLSWLQKNSKRDQETPPSVLELARIKRALYKFEVFCRLFPAVEQDDKSEEARYAIGSSRSENPDFDAAQMSFLSFLSPWEREQLACIHESLWRQVAPGKSQ